MNILESFFRGRELSNKVAVFENQKSVTYKDLYSLSKSFSLKINSKEQNIAIYMSSNIDYLIALFGVWFSNKTAVPIGANLSENEVKKIMLNSDSNTLITTKLHQDKFSPDVHNLIVMDTVNLKKYNETNHELKENFPALIIPTSGTTGSPKLVKVSHDNLYFKAKELIKEFSVNEEITELAILPITTLSVLASHCIPVFMSGGTLVIYSERINPVRIGELIQEKNVKITAMTPTLLNLFLQMEGVPWNKLALLDALAVGGEKVPQSLIDKVESHLGKNKLVPLYGLSETTASVVGGIIDNNIPKGSIGKIYEGIDIKIVDQNKKDVKNGEYGEIWLKGLSVTDSYYNNKAVDEATFSDGWLKTGDIGAIDSKGYLYIKGRMKNIIISAGQNIYPEEVEEYLLSHENITQVVVFPSEDPILGEVPKAMVVLTAPNSVNQSELYNYCRKGLANFKIPKEFYIRESIDLVGMGKVGRNVD